MIPVVLEYRPIGLLPFQIRRKVKLPVRWSEVTPRQLIQISSRMTSQIDSPEVLHTFLGISRRLARRLDEYQGFSITRYLEFSGSVKEHDSFIIKSIMGLPAPQSKLKGVTFGCFIFADTYFQAYLEKKNVEDLNRFIACFYQRIFREEKVEKLAKRVGRAKLVKRQAIAVNYFLIREWLARSYTYVFSKEAPVKKSGKKARTGWVNVFDAVVGDDISNQEKYAEQPLSQVLRFLNRKTKEYYKNGGNV